MSATESAYLVSYTVGSEQREDVFTERWRAEAFAKELDASSNGKLVSLYEAADTPSPLHDCEEWAMEGIGCAHCNPIAQQNRDGRHSLLRRAESVEAALAALRGALTAKAEEWRKEAAKEQRVSFCADELDALVSATPAGATPPEPPSVPWKTSPTEKEQD